MSEGPTFLAISIGNTHAAIATVRDGQVQPSVRCDAGDTPAIVDAALKAWAAMTPEATGEADASIVLASVNEEPATAVAAGLKDQVSQDIWRIGDDLPVPIGRHLDPESLTGVDRLLSAAGAWEAIKQACVVVDAGTAVTVDFVDGEGTFHGGAIAPGAAMQLAALHGGTASLPEITFEAPLQEAFGKNTAQAMLQGVFHGIRGMVRHLTEQYADRYGAYPLIIATGGDAEVLFGDDELIERIVPDLQLMGMVAAVRHALAPEADA